MNIAVTGAAGFIGTNLTQNLILKDVQILAVTRSQLSNRIANAKVDVLECDIYQQNESHLDQIAKADVLIHLAWGGLPNYNSTHHFEYELPSQYQFLKELINRGLKNVVVSGTCLEYGLLAGALSEDMQTNPVTAYALAKDGLREQLQFLQQDHNFNLSWLRLFYTFGEGQAKGSLLPLLKSAVENGKDSFDMSAGDQVRDYLHIDELVDLIAKVAIKQQNIGVVNVCSGQGITVRELAQKWIKENDWDIKLNFGKLPYPDYEPLEFWGNRNKLDNVLSQP